MNEYALLPSLVWSWSVLGEVRRNEEGTLLALLAGIAETGSVAQAARDCGFSYRHAWGVVRTWEERLRQPLVDMVRGSGSTLAPLGLRLVHLDARLKSRFAAQLAAAAEEVRLDLTPFMGAGMDRLTLHASHDPLLTHLPEALRGQGVELELHVLGSSESLASLAAGRCDIAGFHCPQGPLGAAVWKAYRAHLDPRAHVLIRFAQRSQGLMLADGNPRKLKVLHDLTRSGVRYVNRQSGSGTRLLFDLLLADQHLQPLEIDGYANEEFTHAAVAATIASGAADAGLGVEAAARRFGLDFIPLVREDYYLAIRRDALAHPALGLLLKYLATPAWRRLLAAEPGYVARGSGKLVECQSAWRSTTAAKAAKSAVAPRRG
ncbi:MAG: LysR family transcriptional regulator [Proteobacteria bacterium]|nr:LysR family transcriptional regulator [Pseudomonadota bacterium]